VIHRLIGISVTCTVCGHRKKPHGRSAPPELKYCDSDCPGYELEPKPGCLWPGETSEEFGYNCCTHATRDTQGVPVWNIEGTPMGKRFEEHLRKSEGNFKESEGNKISSMLSDTNPTIAENKAEN